MSIRPYPLSDSSPVAVSKFLGNVSIFSNTKPEFCDNVSIFSTSSLVEDEDTISKRSYLLKEDCKISINSALVEDCCKERIE
jgi:hypothetical protein